MKKLVLLLAAAAMAVSVNAQTVTESKTFDNFYIGINGGVQTKTTGYSWLKNLNPNAGVRIGRWFTPVFGLAAESNVYFSNKPYESFGTVVRYMNTGLIATVNASNWFAGYKGEPRTFEVIPVFGFGWAHSFNNKDAKSINALTSKAGIDFAFNLGKAKAWQVYIEPSMNWALNGTKQAFNEDGELFTDGTAYNINKSAFQLNAGIIYKFKNSNGTHNFTIAQLRDQNEIDGLNSQINSLRGDLNNKDAQISAKDKEIADLKNQLANQPKYVKPATATNLQPTVLFQQGKSNVERSQMPNIELIAQYMKNHPDAKVEIKGYASPEGNKDFNQALSQKRADAVKNILVKNYKISADRLTAKGMGATDKLFKQVEFNRVSTFNDSSVQD